MRPMWSARGTNGYGVGGVDEGPRVVAAGSLDDRRQIGGAARLRLDQAEGDQRGAGSNAFGETLERDGANGGAVLSGCHEQRKEDRGEFVVGDEHLVARGEGCGDRADADRHRRDQRHRFGLRADQLAKRGAARLAGLIPGGDPVRAAGLPVFYGAVHGCNCWTRR